MPAITVQVERLSKAFAVRRRGRGLRGAFSALLPGSAELLWAVRDLDFRMERGEIVGLLGPNGAGKSTLIKMLTGILVPTSGRALVRGVDPAVRRREHASQIGVVFGQRTQLWWDLPLVDSFELLRAIYRVPEARYRENLARFREVLELDAFLGTPVRQLSLGQRMRGDLAAALLHDPPVLFLDEPTIGLDIVAKQRIRDLVAEMNRAREVTIILTTHDLDDVEKLCPRVVMIDHGKLLFDGALEALRTRHGGERLLLVDLAAAVDAADVRAALLPGAELLRSDHQRHVIRFARGGPSAAQLIAAVSARLPVTDLQIHEQDIDDVVARIYREGIA
jgi:viologen exporter family transport system ATP-binding protein